VIVGLAAGVGEREADLAGGERERGVVDEIGRVVVLGPRRRDPELAGVDERVVAVGVRR